MLTLLRVKGVHAPEPLDADEILFADGRIAAIGRDLPAPQALGVTIVERRELIAVPGFIDQHVHVTGGGGEGGPATRCPEISAAAIARAGITTVVGLLGFDGISRSPADLLAKTRGLAAEGLSAYMYSGAYRVPPPTLTGDIARDIAYVPEVLGIGEIAISDHRSTQPTAEAIARLVGEARLGGMLAGKRGICHFHVGDGARRLALLRELLSETEVPANQVIPTHCNRTPELLADAADYARTYAAAIDITAFEDAEDTPSWAVSAVHSALNTGVAATQLTLSSDCNGSIPAFDATGRYAGMRVATNAALLDDFRTLAATEQLGLETALRLVSTNVASVLGLEHRKGRIQVGHDADVTLLDTTLQPQMVFASGQPLL